MCGSQGRHGYPATLLEVVVTFAGFGTACKRACWDLKPEPLRSIKVCGIGGDDKGIRGKVT